MTVIAGIGTRHMVRLFTYNRRIIMTADTGSRYAGVIKPRRRPRHSQVTVIAIVAAGYMIWWLAGLLHIVMTTDTTGTD